MVLGKLIYILKRGTFTLQHEKKTRNTVLGQDRGQGGQLMTIGQGLLRDPTHQESHIF